jgi:hypothetical protein
MNKELNKLYTNPSIGFSGINNLLRKAKESKIKNIKQQDVVNYLKGELPHTTQTN